MFEVRSLNEYGYRNTIKFESEYLAQKEFAKRQNDLYVNVSLWKDEKCVVYGEKINRKWYFSIMED